MLVCVVGLEDRKLWSNTAATLAATFPPGIAANYAVGDELCHQEEGAQPETLNEMYSSLPIVKLINC